MSEPCRIKWGFEVPEGGGWLLNYPLCRFDRISDNIYSETYPLPLGDEAKRAWFLDLFNFYYERDNDVIGVAMSELRDFRTFYVDLLFANRADAMLFKLTWDGGAA
ncbi:hypothetical protein [Rhizobium sp. 2MFCol3.1]|uniref:hypothetical protein n=1 Tax=Rhizobium sp. 2MFCol3.1 TaxID=1246459 RepID=UPI000370F2D2|nr:hypothetical protein [Rhizobium sp. 2MFCol3.1]